MAKKEESKVICQSRKARFNYALEEFYEGGLVLVGSEVKSLREGRAQIDEAYASFSKGELWLIGAHIAKYEHAGVLGHDDERRSRKILMHESELKKLREAIQKKGMSLIPVKLKWVRGKAKVELGLGLGKKLFDKRGTIKDREWGRQKQRIFKGSNQ